MTRNGATFSNIDPEIDQLLHPSRFYARPTDVIADELLTVDERRAILSSWASDACAVESHPALRQPPQAKAPVIFDEIMDALMQLDCLKASSTGQMLSSALEPSAPPRPRRGGPQASRTPADGARLQASRVIRRLETWNPMVY